MTENQKKAIDEATGKLDEQKLQEVADLDATAGGATPATIPIVVATITVSASTGVCPSTDCTAECNK